MEAKRPRKRIAEIPMAIRRQRIDEMCRLFERGVQPADIAHKFQLNTSYVRHQLKDRGYDTSRGWVQAERVDSMWEMDDDERRQMIVQRAAKAARAARLAVSP